MKYYKILEDKKSCHGGDMEWRVGKWMRAEGELIPCKNGIHLTTKPYMWYTWNCDCYEAIPGDEIIKCEGDKIVTEKAKLMRKIEHPKWWKDVHKQVENLNAIKWLSMSGKIKKDWKIFYGKNWNAAYEAAMTAARNAAYEAARNAAYEAARDFAMNAAWNTAWNTAYEATRDFAMTIAGDVAWNTAYETARIAAGNVAMTIAGDVALYARIKVCHGLKLDKKHIDHARKRMEVWERGYGLYCDVDGVLYVYGVKNDS